MKKYNSKLEFFIGLIGVIMHTIIVLFIVGYLSDPTMLEEILPQTSGEEHAMLLSFLDDVNSLSFMIYIGSAIVVFEWMAIFRILKYTDKMTPVWALFLILGALYAYVYFGGLEV